MKIKRPPKKSPSTSPSIAAFILSLAPDQTPDDELPALLWPAVNQGWQWPRTDLQHWIQPLNRFDTILDDVIKDYDLASMEHAQTNAFTPRTKALVGAILAFEKVLLENSTNRKIFASFDRLNDLLRTTDLSILLATLRLALRPAQQYSASHSSSSSFGIAEKRLLSLAQGWGTREHGLEMVDLAAESVVIPPELDEFEWQFYLKASSATAAAATTSKAPEERKEKGKEVADAMDVEGASAEPSALDANSTPAPKPRASFAPSASVATPLPSTPGPSATTQSPSEGLTSVQLGNIRTNPSSAVDILVDAIEQYDVPEPSRLELLQKIRIAKSLSTTSERRTLLVVRLLSIAVFCHTSFESTAQNKLFLYEPELIPQLAELVHPDRDVPIEIQAAAFYALDAIAKFKSKLSEVASVLNASVSHGILMYVLRRTVADLEGDNPVSTIDFTDALFNLLSYFQTTSVGNMIVGAGVVSLLIDFVKNVRRDRLRVITRAIVFLDTLMYGYSSAFNLFVSTSGITTFVDRIKDEVALCLAAYSDVASSSQVVSDAPTGLLSFEQAALLKALFRAIHRLMQTAGTTEGLRNIIDTSLLASVGTIVQYRQIFGPQLFALAINCIAAFIHNEPTCLSTIQEAKVPAALYDAIEESIAPSIDVLQAIPNVIGALCLNAPGLAEFNTRTIIPQYFTIFSSERHVKVLSERDNATMIGTAIDELMRHHPSLKDEILAAVVDALGAVRDLGKAFVPDSPDGYELILAQATGEASGSGTGSGSSEVVMQDATSIPTPLPPPPPPDSATPKPEDALKDNMVLSAIDVIGRFLDGLFQNIAHCKDFIKLEPFKVLLELLALPCVPVMNISSPSYNAISGLFRILSEVKPTDVVTAVLAEVDSEMATVEELWEGFSVESRIGSLLEPTESTLAQANVQFRHFAALLSHIALLSDIYSSLTYSYGKTATTVLSTLSAPSQAQILIRLGELYRATSWETVLLKRATSGAALSSAAHPSSNGEKAVGLEPSDSTDPSQSISSSSPNLALVKDVISNIPTNIAPFLHSVIKLFVHRRSGDSWHRKASLEVSRVIGSVMKANLSWPGSADVSANLSYSTLMIASTSAFLFDERLSTSGIQTLLLVSFEKAGGLTSFLDLYAQYNTIASTLLAESNGALVLPAENGSGPELSLPVVHVFGGIKTALNLLFRLSSHKTLLEAPQTALLLAQNKDKPPESFEPHDFIVKLRIAILPAVVATWDAPWLKKSPPNVVRNIVRTLVNILRAEGEDSTGPTGGVNGIQPSPFAGLPGGLAAAFGGAAAAAGAPFVVDETRVQQLMDMGFPRSAARSALTRCRNNASIATEYLLTHPDIVGAARLAEANEPATPAAAEEPAVVNEGEAPVVAAAEGIATPEEPPADEGAIVPAEGPAVLLGVAAAAIAGDEAVVAPPEPATAGEDVEMGGADGISATATATSTSTTMMTTTTETTSEVVTEAAKEAAKRESDERKKALDTARQALKPTFLPRALSLADEYSDLVFDIKGAFSLFSSAEDEKTAPSIQPLLDELKAAGTHDRSIATRLRVIALLATDAVYRGTIEASRVELMEILVIFQQRYLAELPDPDARPLWLASAMLVADSLLSVAEVPAPTTILPESQAPPDLGLVCQGPKWGVEREKFFELAMHVFRSGVWTREVLISTLRLLLILTRDHNLAASFAQQDGLRHLFKIFSAERPEAEGCRSYAVMILRHIIEEKELLRAIMEKEIGAWFATPRTRVADVTGFLRGTSSSALRNPTIFLHAAQSVCKLVQADASGQYHVALQHETAATTQPTEAESAIRSPFAEAGTTGSDMVVDEATTKPVVPKATAFVQNASPIVDASVHFLMLEVIEFSKLALAPVPSPPPSIASPQLGPLASTSNAEPVSDDARPTEGSSSEKDAAADVPLGDFFQTSFAMSCLAELLSSYTPCKSSFLTFSTRRTAKESTATPVVHKSRSSFLFFLLNDLIPVGSVLAPTEFESKRRTALSTWAALVIVALCHDPEAGAPTKETTAEITAVRKVVLDAIAKAIKEATSSSEPTDVRYGRLFALSDLCCRLLTARPYATVTKPHDEHSMQLAKLMLEKNFAVILTNALADVDLNFPSVNNLINSILRPLEQLTKVVTKVGRSKNATPSARRAVDDTMSTDESEDESVSSLDEDAQEADNGPDIYRNSALGMYEGELETGHAGEDAYMSGDSDEYDEDDEMMEEMEEGIPGSDQSDLSDDDADDVAQFEEELEEMMGSQHDSDEEDPDDEDDDDDQNVELEDGSSGESDHQQMLDGDDVEIIAGIDGGDNHHALLVDEQDDGWVDDGDEIAHENNPDMDAFGAPPEHDQDEDSLDEGGDSLDEEDFEGVLELEFEADMGLPSGILGGRQVPVVDGGWDLLGDGHRHRSRAGQLDDAAAALFGPRAPAANASAPSHPLLVDTPAAESRLDTPILRRNRAASARETPEYQAWVQSIEQVAGPGALEAIQEMLSQHGLSHLSGPEQIRLQRTPGPDRNLAIVIDPVALAGARTATQSRLGNLSRHHGRPSRTPTDRLSATSDFLPVPTFSRWLEESKILQGSVLASERTAVLSNHLINALHPPARALAKQAKIEAAKAQEVEQTRMAEMATKVREAREAREAAEAKDALAEQERLTVEATAQAEDTSAMDVEGSSEHQDVGMEGVTASDDVTEVMNLARSLAAGLGVPSAPTPPNAEALTPDDAERAIAIPDQRAVEPVAGSSENEVVDEEVDEEEDEDNEEIAEASGSGSGAGGERVIISIHGQQHDITDTGIDATFLEALPDDMREEVLTQHFREVQAAAVPPPAVPSQINSEFLDALPADIRAEVLRQEAAEQRREQAAARAAANVGQGDAAAGPTDIDPASFLASLDPQLRQAVLMEQEDNFLSTLPANLIAEANVLREQSNRRLAARLPVAGAPNPAALAPKKAPVHREAIQLLDKSGLATLVRLLFFPQPLRKNSLQKVLVNLCENSRTRMELINLLLTILQDGTRDVSAVDKSFSQMSLRASKALTGVKDTPRRKAAPETPGGASGNSSVLPHFPGESVPNLIAQRCLEALMYLVQTNEQSSLFFLTEQELTVGLNRRALKKGKGKEKAAPSTTFPVNVLVGLLDRTALLKTQSMMDTLTYLLANITKLLSVLQKKVDGADANSAKEGELPQPSTGPTPDALPPSSSAAAGEALPSSAPAPALEDSSELPSTETLVKTPPQIPAPILRLVANILDAGECSSKTFQQTLVLIQNLSYLPDARTIISDELKSRAQALAERLLPDLDELQTAIGSSADVRGVTLAKFSPASSLQAKLLRILKTIDWLHSPQKKAAAADTEAGAENKLSPDEEKVSQIYDSFSFGGVWARLGSCLAAVEQKPELLYIATVLLPLIESLMVVSKYVGAKQHAKKDQRSVHEALSPGLSELPPDSMEATFLTFTDEHRKILNTMVRNNPSLLAGSFEILRHNPKVLEFDNKRSYFFSRLHDRSQRQRSHYGTLQVNVRRQYVFEDSFHNLQRRTGDEIKHGKLSVKFYDEEGVDAGGVTREWFSVLARQMFNPGYALFQPQAADALTYQPNKSSSINPEHLSFFKFVGRIIGKALHDQRILEAYFSRAVYKHMLGRPVDHRDLESIDPEYYKSLVWMLGNDIDGILDLTFSVERDDFGVADVVDLIPDGRNVAVTNENKAEYVRLIADQRLSVEIKEQMDAMLKGLYEIVPKDLLRIFSEKELELLISGLPEIDVDEWRANTVLHNFSPSDPVIGYFWRVVRSFSMEERAKLLQFVSGSSRVPLDGFGSLQGMTGVTKFSITNAGNTKALPTAHTCFNQLDIASNFESYEELRKALLTAILEGGEGFGFA